MSFLYLYRVRATSPQTVAEVCRVFRHTLSLFQEPGWLGGSCVVNQSDPTDVVIYEIWGNLASLHAWLDSDARRQAHRDLAPFVVGPALEETFEEV